MLNTLNQKWKKIRRVFVTVIIVAIIATNTVSLVAFAASAYGDTLGTAKSLGSPLVDESFVLDDWDSWEMLCFGVFISNFCQPFQDSYTTAFTEGRGGSEGAGLKAMQFAAGGDTNSEGLLSDMLDYCKMAQSQNVRKISVKYNYYEFGKDMGLDLGERDARLLDLFPRSLVLKNAGSFANSIAGTANIDRPLVSYYPSGTAKISDNEGKNTGSDKKDTYIVNLCHQAVLSTFTVKTNDGSSEVFSLKNGFDLQIIMALINKANQAGVDLEGLAETNPVLYFDIFGNICMQNDSGNDYIVIIPASANQHITETNSMNLLNSLVVNSFSSGSSNEKMLVNSSASLNGESDPHGGAPAVSDSGDIKEGKLILYNDTDVLVSQALYKYMQSQTVEDPPTLEVVDDTEGNKTVAIDKLHYKIPNKTLGPEDLPGFTYGNALSQIINLESISQMPLKLEITGCKDGKTYSGGGWNGFVMGLQFWKDHEGADNAIASDSIYTLSLLENMFPTEKYDSSNRLDWFYAQHASADKNKAKVDLFDKSQYYYLSPATSRGNNKIVKDYVDFFLKIADNSYSTASSFPINKSTIRSNISQCESFRNVTNIALVDGVTSSSSLDSSLEGSALGRFTMSAPFKSYLESRFELKQGVSSISKISSVSFNATSSYLDKAKSNYSGYLVENIKKATNSLFTYDMFKRITKVYKPAENFSVMAHVYDIDPDAQFKLYITDMYLSYLDFYGIIGKGENKFNKKIFANADFLNFDSDSFNAGDAMTKEEKDDAIRNNSYLLLAPTKAGRNYRAALVDGLQKDICKKIYETTVDSGSNSGFLNVSTYEDNFITSWIIDNYGWIQLVLFGLLAVSGLISAVLSGKSFMGMICTIGAIAVTLAIIPTYMSITPYVCNKVINGFYSANGMYWAILESVNNLNAEAQAVEADSDENKQKQIVSLLSSGGFLQQDRTLMVKNDISKKVVEQGAINYDEIQSLQTMRWLLPSLMEQVTYKGNYNYVSIPLSGLYDNMELSWLVYKDISGYKKVAYVPPKEKNVLQSVDGKKNWFGGYTGTSKMGADIEDTTTNVSRIRNDTELPHTQLYILDIDIGLPDIHSGTESVGEKEWENYSKTVKEKVKSDAFLARHSSLVDKLNKFNANDVSPSPDFGYLWTTENLGVYFYALVRDTFGDNADKSVGYIMYNLQGTLGENEDGDKVRVSFMHQGTTGYIRDVLDLEEIFTNVLPYMYQMQLTAGGDTGTNGVLGAAKLTGYDVYKDNDAAWLYRCNWATKIMEDRMYNSSATVSYKVGDESKKATIKSIIDPRNYPSDRPMVFSEAQMHSQGLEEKDLTYAELKCLAANKKATEEWTKLINYANVSDLDNNTIFRTMALTSLLTFNKTFTRDNFINEKDALFPTGIDLRNISFDTLMRRMISSSTDGYNLGGSNLVEAAIENSGLFKTLLLILAAAVSSSIMPFVRDLVLCAIFICCIISVVLNYSVDTRGKIKASAGWFLTTCLFCGLTCVYYLIFAALCGRGDSGTLLRSGNMTINANLLSKLLSITAVTGIYIYELIKYIKNYVIANKFAYVKDGGFSMFYDVASRVSNTIGGKISRVGKKVSSIGAKAASSVTKTASKEEIVNSKDNPVNSRNVDDSNGNGDGTKKRRRKNQDEVEFERDPADSGYVTEPVKNERNKRVTKNVQEEINKGKKEIEKENSNKANNVEVK